MMPPWAPTVASLLRFSAMHSSEYRRRLLAAAKELVTSYSHLEAPVTIYQTSIWRFW